MALSKRRHISYSPYLDQARDTYESARAAGFAVTMRKGKRGAEKGVYIVTIPYKQSEQWYRFTHGGEGMAKRNGSQTIVTDARGLAKLMKNPAIRRRVRNISEGATEGRGPTRRFIPFREAVGGDYDPRYLSKKSLAHETAAIRAEYDPGYRKKRAVRAKARKKTAAARKRKPATKKQTVKRPTTKRKPAARKRSNPGYLGQDYHVVETSKPGHGPVYEGTGRKSAQRAYDTCVRAVKRGDLSWVQWSANGYMHGDRVIKEYPAR